MAVSFKGGSVLPSVGSVAYKAAQQGSGTGSFNPSTGALTINNQIQALQKAAAPPALGTSGAPAGSQAPVAPLAPPKPGTTGNPAGMNYVAPIKQTTATTSSTALGVPKKDDWQSTLANVQASNAQSRAAGGQVGLPSNLVGNMSTNSGPAFGGTSSGPLQNYTPYTPAPPKPQSGGFLNYLGGLAKGVGNTIADAYKTSNFASALDAYNTGTSVLGPKTAEASTGGLDYNNPSNNALQLGGIAAMTRVASAGVPSYATPTTGAPTANIGPTMSPTANQSPLPQSPSQTNPLIAAAQSPIQSQTNALTNAATPKTLASFGVDNTKNKAPVLDQTQKLTQAVDSAKNEAAASAAAVTQATTDEDRKYYADLASQKDQIYQQALADQQKYMALSDEEKQAQARLDAEQSALNLGLVDTAGQPIPLGFITGQQKALESRSLARQQPLQQQLARLQQQRQSNLDVAKTTASAAREASNAAQSNKENYSSEARKRQQQLQDQQTTNSRSDRERAQTQANIQQKFNQDVKEFGIATAQRNMEIAIQQQNADSTRINANKPGASTNSKVTQGIYQQMSTQEFKNMTTAQKRDYIMYAGGNPADFGY